MSEWFENESFWKETYNFLFPEKLFKETNEQVENVLELVDFHGSSVLDLCCGPGRCSIVLAKKGFSVTGVDLSPFLLDKAKEKSKSQNLNIEWVLEDMRRFVRPLSYDLVLNMFTSFGYFDDKSDDLVVLENVFTSLKPGGAFLIDVMGKETMAKIFQPTISNVLSDGTMVVQRPEIYDDWSRVKNDWTIIKGDRAKTFTFHHTVYSGQELKDCMVQSGFKNIKLYGSLDGTAYDSNAQHLVIVGFKPKEPIQ
jgi:SAM-dependent methyltransferase